MAVERERWEPPSVGIPGILAHCTAAFSVTTSLERAWCGLV
ncbi:hypothetical protein [Dactylosporangium fulvum]|uniref:Uncharacterized protein n=1 Tax=Dactylosporangium fulvum TaxID=53359 RepID=A0ABY5WBG4_9ACTN|nr:hypothetical protein [Dactylosporangium fulvum]UWP86616.1 hypothetical protein Dfulv_21195 [Dactylosporangium fulvum]